MAARIQRNHRIVAIVGRPNVGKSALFNRLAGRRIAIVHDQPGVTRDRLSAPLYEAAFPIHIIDTGGIGATLSDDFGEAVRAEADIAITSADVILFVVDALSGIHPVDLIVAQVLRKQGKPVILGINKSDDPKHDNMHGDFARMGFKTVCSISAEHGRGIDRLVKTIEHDCGPPPEPAEVAEGEEIDPLTDPRTVRVAIVGRPNVGKSSLFNAILGDDRAIVSDVAGTTRDSIDSYVNHRGHPFLLIDTAGIRKRGKVDTEVEAFSVKRAERSIRRADCVALVIDAARGVTAQERKIAGTILDENKPCIVIANKFDLYHPGGQMSARLAELEEHVKRELYFLHYAPLVAVSAKNKDRLNKIFGAIDKVREASEAALGTGAFNRLLSEAIERQRPPAIKGRRFKLFYATLAREEQQRPISAPRVVLFVNHRELMTPTYTRYLENTLRDKMTYTGLPIRFDVRERQQNASVTAKRGGGTRKAPGEKREKREKKEKHEKRPRREPAKKRSAKSK